MVSCYSCYNLHNETHKRRNDGHQGETLTAESAGPDEETHKCEEREDVEDKHGIEALLVAITIVSCEAFQRQKNWLAPRVVASIAAPGTARGTASASRCHFQFNLLGLRIARCAKKKKNRSTLLHFLYATNAL
jgi:hypothetical protein